MGGSRAYRARLELTRSTVRSAASLQDFEGNHTSFVTSFSAGAEVSTQSSTVSAVLSEAPRMPQVMSPVAKLAPVVRTARDAVHPPSADVVGKL